MGEKSQARGFFTDTTICIGCKACEVACKEWNGLPADGYTFTGMSYDNTGHLGGSTWRHVAFVEKPVPYRDGAEEVPYRDGLEEWSGFKWLMMSDVCKHCVNAPCLEVCPTGALMRTEFDSVYIQENVCNGCRNCIAACPFGVIHISGTQNDGKGTAKKCTLCYDRLQHNLTPACAQACPTESIQFGPIADLKARAEARLAQLQGQGFGKAQLYGADEKVLGGLNAFYLLLDEPEVYGLPRAPKLPSRSVLPSSLISIGSAIVMGIAALFTFRVRRVEERNAREAARTNADGGEEPPR